MERPDYGGAEWHVFINLLLGTILLLIAVLGFAFYNFLFLFALIPSGYFFLNALKWRKGGLLEERLRIREELIRFVQPKDGDKILDVGTGGGLLAIGFAKAIKHGEIIGIDRWIPLGGGTSLERAIRNARIEGVADKVKFEKGDARNIPYPDNYFDIVVASFVIHIIRKEREKALREMIRVLKPGGKFAIIEPPKEYWTKWRVDNELKKTLEEIGLRNVKFKPIRISYPKERNVYIIYGEKAEITS